MNAGFGSSSNHDVGFACLDETSSVTKRVGACCARSCDGMVWTLVAVRRGVTI